MIRRMWARKQAWQAGGFGVGWRGMKKAVAAKKIDWDAECERTRQRCNRLSDDERRALREKALRLIYHSNAEAPARGR